MVILQFRSLHLFFICVLLLLALQPLATATPEVEDKDPTPTCFTNAEEATNHLTSPEVPSLCYPRSNGSHDHSNLRPTLHTCLTFSCKHQGAPWKTEAISCWLLIIHLLPMLFHTVMQTLITQEKSGKMALPGLCAQFHYHITQWSFSTHSLIRLSLKKQVSNQ